MVDSVDLVGCDGTYIVQRVRILAGFDVVGFLLLSAHFYVVALLAKVADCVHGWTRFAIRLCMRLLLGFMLRRSLLVFASYGMSRGTDFCLHSWKLSFSCLLSFS